MSREADTIKMRVSPNIHRYIEAMVDEVGIKGSALAAGETKEERVQSFENWAITYLIAKRLSESGHHDDDVSDYVLVMERNL